MATYEQIEEFWGRWFGHMTNANTQAAKGELHALLGTQPAKLEDKQTNLTMKKIEPDYTPELSQEE